MTITRRQTISGTFDQTTQAGQTILEATWPSPTLAGSLLLAVVGESLVSTGSTTWTPPAGWTEVGRAENASNTGVVLFEIVGAAARSGKETFRITSASRDSTLTLIECTSTDPLVRSALGAGATGSSTAPATASVAADAAGSILRVAGIANRNNDTQSSPTNGFSQVAQPQSPTATAGNRVNCGVFQLIETAGATPAAKACAVTLGTSRPWAARQVIYREQPAPPPAAPVEKVRTSSAWVSSPGPAKVWTGSAWA